MSILIKTNSNINMSWFFSPNAATSGVNNPPLTRNRSQRIYDNNNENNKNLVQNLNVQQNDVDQFKQTIVSNNNENLEKEISEFEILPKAEDELSEDEVPSTETPSNENCPEPLIDFSGTITGSLSQSNTSSNPFDAFNEIVETVKTNENLSQDENLSHHDKFAANTVPVHTFESTSDSSSDSGFYPGDSCSKTYNDNVVDSEFLSASQVAKAVSPQSDKNDARSSCQHSYVDEEKIKNMLDKNVNNVSTSNNANNKNNTPQPSEENNRNGINRNELETMVNDGINCIYPHLESVGTSIGSSIASVHTKINNQMQAYQNHEKKLSQNTHVNTIYNTISKAAYKGRSCKYRAYDILEQATPECQVECNIISTKIMYSGIFIGKVNSEHCTEIAQIFHNMGFNVNVSGVEQTWSSAEDTTEYQFMTITPK